MKNLLGDLNEFVMEDFFVFRGINKVIYRAW